MNSKKAMLIGCLTTLAMVMTMAGSCGVEGNITQVRPMDSSTYQVGVKDHVNDPKVTWVPLDIRYRQFCGVGDQYPQCKKKLDDQH
jgi:hypothetical protein